MPDTYFDAISPPDAVSNDCWHEGIVHLHRDGSWSPSEGDGSRCAIAPIFDPECPLIQIDAVAWPLTNPGCWWMRRGVVTYLGASELHRCWWENRPIRLLATPRDWICDPGPGPSACILQWDADLRAILACLIHENSSILASGRSSGDRTRQSVALLIARK